MSRQESQFTKWEWAVRKRQSFSLISKLGMSREFVRSAERACMDTVGERTGMWIAHINQRMEPSAESGAVIALKRSGGETVDVTVRGWKSA